MDSVMGPKHETMRLGNSTYDVLIALGKEAPFLYSAVDNYTSDAEKENKSDLVDMWNTIKQDRTRHTQKLREALASEASQEKLTQ
jgi:hypothetical protein